MRVLAFFFVKDNILFLTILLIKEDIMSDKFEYNLIDSETKGNIFNNPVIKNYFNNEGFTENNALMRYVSETRKGSIVYDVGTGNKSLMIIAGVHGDELAPQIAVIKFMEEILNGEWNLRCKLYIVPFLIPKATMQNTRFLDYKDMNRQATNRGITKYIIDYALSHNVVGLCDCHSTDPNKKPGYNSVFCSIRPLVESSMIARYICKNTNSRLLPVYMAGSTIMGSVEDESNLRGIPSVTCESVSPVCKIDPSGVAESYNQLISFLNYFKVI